MDRDETFIDLDDVEDIAEQIEALGEVPSSNLEEYPYLLREWIKSASEVSTKNEVPCALGFISLLSTICSDIVAVKFKRNVEDCRIHFCWIQTTGSGKSTLFNFLGPVLKGVYTRINAIEATKEYDLVDVKDFTTPALIGSVKEGSYT